MKKNGVNVVYHDLKLTPLNPNVTPDVQRLKAAGADFVISCMTIGGNLSLARASKEYGLDAKMLWLTVPNQSVITKNASLLQGVFFGEGNVPSAANTKYPGTYPGLAAYNAAIKKYEPSVAGDNIALQGWESAALLVAGIEAAGKNFTQASVVQATNRLTQFTAGGLYTPMNWVYTHTTVTEPYCEAFVQAQGTKLLPVLEHGQAGLRLLRQDTEAPDTGGHPAGHPRSGRALIGGLGGGRGRASVEQFLGFAIPGIPYGCAYAIFAVGLVLTYQATGVFNFAYGAQAYTSAFLFAWLIETRHWPVWTAFVLAVLIVGPGLGLAFDRLLFRHIPSTNSTAKLVTGLSLLVGIPTLLPILFGNGNLTATPPIGFSSTFYFHLFGISAFPITGFDASTVIFTVIMLVALVILMRFTPLGLRMRGAVESRRLVQLDGVNAGGVVAVAWAVSGLMAGLVGVLFASSPLNTILGTQIYITLMVAAIAAAAWGVLRSMPIAAGVGVLMGVISLTARGYLTPNSVWYAAVLPALPFIALVGALLFVPGLRSLDDSKDPLATVDPPTPPTAAASRAPQFDRIIKGRGTCCWPRS